MTFLGNFKLFWFWTNIFIPRWCSTNFWNKCTICQTFVTLGSLVCIFVANLSPYLWKFLNQASATLGLGRGNSCNFDRLTFLMMFGLHSLLLILYLHLLKFLHFRMCFQTESICWVRPRHVVSSKTIFHHVKKLVALSQTLLLRNFGITILVKKLFQMETI